MFEEVGKNLKFRLNKNNIFGKQQQQQYTVQQAKNLNKFYFDG